MVASPIPWPGDICDAAICAMTLHGLPVRPRRGLVQGSPASQPQQCGSVRAANTTSRGQRQRMPPGSLHHPCLKPHKSAPALVQLRAAAGRVAGGGNGSAPDANRNAKPAQTTRWAAHAIGVCPARATVLQSRLHIRPTYTPQCTHLLLCHQAHQSDSAADTRCDCCPHNQRAVVMQAQVGPRAERAR